MMALLHMDSQRGAHLVTTREMADLFHIPGEILGKVLQKLAKADLLESVHGVNGGYRLRGAIETIRLGHVIECLEGPLHLVKCDEDPDKCEQFAVCNIREPALRIQRNLMNYIYGLSLAAFRGSLDVEELAVAFEGKGGASHE